MIRFRLIDSEDPLIADDSYPLLSLWDKMFSIKHRICIAKSEYPDAFWAFKLGQRSSLLMSS